MAQQNQKLKLPVGFVGGTNTLADGKGCLIYYVINMNYFFINSMFDIWYKHCFYCYSFNDLPIQIIRKLNGIYNTKYKTCLRYVLKIIDKIDVNKYYVTC